MTHCPAHDELERYARGELTEERALAIDEHLDNCRTCQDFVASREKRLPLHTLHEPSAADAFLGELAAEESRRRAVVVGPGDSAAGAERTEAWYLTERPGMTIGPYKLLEQIGEGGFGIVFMAEQAQPVRRRVALKVIKPGMDTRQVIARFEAERQALALMDHSNIARVYDAGESMSGRPYFVMELVKGISITQYCDHHRCTLRERLALFVDVCRAVQHAHQKGIIHRDLKPSNVLVTLHGDVPVVKVIDFGVAKATGEPLTDKTLFTAFAQFVGTPLYMSPEQAALSGLDVDTRSDVYSLGVMLYELLTGTTPLEHSRLKEVAFDEVRRLIREEEPQRPSTRISTLREKATGISASRKTDPDELRQLLRQELDWIVLKALEKDRARRYESPGSFARDIERYLRDEPVEACPPRWSYRFTKFVRKHRAGVASAIGVAAALTAMLVLAVLIGIERGKAAIKGQRDASLAAWSQGREMCDDGDVGEGLLVLAHALEVVPEGDEYDHLREALRWEIGAWHPHCHTLVQAWQHNGVRVDAVAASPKRLVAVTGCRDGNVRVWDVERDEKDQCIFNQPAHPGGVFAIAFFASDQHFISGGADGRALVWDAETLTYEELLGHQDAVLAVAFSPDERFVLTGSADHTARLWDVREKRCVAVLEHAGDVAAVGFHPHDGTFFTAGADETERRGDFRIYDARDTANLQFTSLKGKTRKKRINAAAISADGDTLVLGDNDWEASFWDWQSREQIAWEERSHGNVLAVAFAPVGHVVLTGADESDTAHLWDVSRIRARWRQQISAGVSIDTPLQSGALPPPLWHPGAITAAAFLPAKKGRLFVTACADGVVRMWKQAPGWGARRLPHHPRSREQESNQRDYVVRTIALNSAGSLVATGGDDGRVQAWKVSTGQPHGESLQHPGKVMSLAFSPDGRKIMTGAGDGLVRWWDYETGECVSHLVHQEGREVFFSQSLDGTLLLTGGGGCARLWNLRDRPPDGGNLFEEVGQPWLHSKDNRSNLRTAIAPKLDQFLTVGDDGAALLWKRESSSPTELYRTTRPLWDGVFAPNEEKGCAIAADEGGVDLWTIADGEQQAHLPVGAAVYSIAYAPSGSWLVSGSRDGAQIWDLHLRRRIGPVYRTDEETMQVVCSADGARIAIADWGGYGWLWNVPSPVEGTPQQIRRWLENQVGLRGEFDLTGSPSFSAHTPIDSSSMETLQQ